MLVAWFRGFIRETLTILSLAGASISALYGSPYIIPSITDWILEKKGEENTHLFGVIPYEVIGIGIAYILIFVVVFILLSFATHWLAKTAKEAGLGALDRSLGVLFGLVRALVLIGVLFIPFSVGVFMDEEKQADFFEGSITLPYVDYTARFMLAAIPNPLGKDENAGEEGGTEEEEKKGPLSVLQNKAFNNIEDAGKLLKQLEEQKKVLEQLEKDGAQLPKGDGKEGYTEENRKALEQLFQNQNFNE